jgi:hypothetical protein
MSLGSADDEAFEEVLEALEEVAEEEALSALTPSPFPQDPSSIALDTALEDPIPADSDFGAAQPLSAVLSSGQPDPIGTAQWGWASGSQQDDPYAGGAGAGATADGSAPGGPSDPFGAAQWGWASGSQEVYAYSGAPQDGTNAGALNGSLGDYTGAASGASAGPYLDPDFESLWSAGKAGGLDTSRYSAAIGDVVPDDPTVTPHSGDPASLYTPTDTVTITGNKNLPDGVYQHFGGTNSDGVVFNVYTGEDGEIHVIEGGPAPAQSPAPVQSSELPNVPAQIPANSSIFANSAPNLTTAPGIFTNSTPASTAAPLAPMIDPVQTQLSNVAGSLASTQPGAVSYDPMAGSPVARWLLKGGASTPIRDFVTNDALLRGLQYGAIGLAALAGAGLLLTGAAAAGGSAGVLAGTGGTTSAAAADSVGLVAETTGSTAASNAPGVLARLLADTAGSGSSTTAVKAGLAAVGVGVANVVASNPGIANELRQEITALPSELPTLQTEYSTLARQIEEGGGPSGPSIPEQAATMLQNIVRQAESFLRANRDLIVELGGSSRGAPVTSNQLGAAGSLYARGSPGFARALAGNAMEAITNAIVEDIAPELFAQVSGPGKIDFIGKAGSIFEGLSFEVTTEAGVAGHALRVYMQSPGAMIFTYESLIP